MDRQILTCAKCRCALTRPIRQLEKLPEPTPIDEVSYEPTVKVGTWAIDPRPRLMAADGSPEGSAGCLIANPEDGAGLTPHPDPDRNSGCCGHDGLDGPNLLCPGCSTPVATLTDDCWTLVEIRFEPEAVEVTPCR